MDVGSVRGKRITLVTQFRVIDLLYTRCRSRVLCLTNLWSSERMQVEDAWAHEGDEGRGKLR